MGKDGHFYDNLTLFVNINIAYFPYGGYDTTISERSVVEMELRDDGSVWKWLDEFRGKDFTGEWPTVVELFDITTKRYPNNNSFIAMSPKKEVFTYAQAREKISRFGNWLVSKGVVKGDRVGVTGKNSPEWAIAYLGIL
jgi:hypothetical protein